MSGERTRTDHPTGHPPAEGALHPVPTVVDHPDPACLGRRHVLREGEALVLGRRAACFGAGALDESRISRRHLELRRQGGGTSFAELGSRNGTSLNGVRASAGDLAPGDVLGIGHVLVLFHLGPRSRQPPRHPSLVGESWAFAEMLGQVALLAPRPLPGADPGETGVGEELVAHELHRQSGRRGEFVAANCGALADGVVLSELFGHVRGAFSGAEAERRGLVDAARGGTLLLDEIGDASPALQANLLRLLEQREYRQVGSDRLLSSDARIVAATHVDLEAAVAAGRFRRDLLARLDRWVIRVPPLRERPEDILPLARHLAAQSAGAGAAAGLAALPGEVPLTRPLAVSLLRHPWPANVRELEGVMDQAVAEAGGGCPWT